MEVFAKLELFFLELIEQIDEGLFLSRSREGIFSPALTMWLMICQRTQSRHSLVGALESLREGNGFEILERNTGSKKAKRKDVSANSGGYCKARKRVSLRLTRQVAETISERIISEQRKTWHGKKVFIMDGTLITLEHTPEILSKFPSYSNQHRISHNSQLRCMCFHELFSGAALSPVIGAYRGSDAESEQALSLKMLPQLPKNSLVIGDSNFGVFNIVYHAALEGHQVLVRLTENRAQFLCNDAASAKPFDREVTWTPSALYRKKYPGLSDDAAVSGRIIKRIIRNPGCHPLTLYFFTTSTESAKRLVKLYGERDRVEHDIRALKYTLGMEMLHSKTPEILEKELVLAFAAYNLMRSVVAAAAKKISLAPRQISFSRACAFVRIYGNKIRVCSSQAEARKLLEEFYTCLRQSKLPNRARFRVEPRKVARVKKRFPPLRKTRAEERQIAQLQLEIAGHRKQETPAEKKRKRNQKLHTEWK